MSRDCPGEKGRKSPVLGRGLDSLFGEDSPDEKTSGSDPGRKTFGRGLDGLFGSEEPEPAEETGKGLSVRTAAVAGILILILGGALQSLLSNVRLSSPIPAQAGVFAESRPPQSPQSASPPSATREGANGAEPPSAPAHTAPSRLHLPEPQDFHKEAMKDTLHEHFPTSPADIRMLKESLKKTQEAVHGPVPSGRSISVDVSLDPGATFPTVHLVPGIATVVNVVDQTGKPWPISDVIVGNAKGFTVMQLSNGSSVVVEPKNSVGWTSLSFTLVGQDTPAVLKLVDSDRVSDTRVLARIEALGPNATIPVFTEQSPVVSRDILDFLDGLPPSSARPVGVKGTEDMEAWLYRNDLFVRTHMDVLAPAWLQTVSGNNGMKLYVFRPTSVITATSADGTMSTVEVEMEGGENVEK